MPLICYTPKTFRGESATRIDQANAIIADYRKQGLTLTLRQLYYRLVAADIIPNNFRSYKNLQRIINDARLAGLIDWDAIEDRTRNLTAPAAWDSPADIMNSAAYSYRRRVWEEQPIYVEAWVEKDALLGVLEKACRDFRLPFFSCRGYTSQSEVWTAAMRLKHKGKPCLVLHLGDHDPSGVDMTRDIEERFALFGATDVTVNRLALNMDQILTLNPPPNPVKYTDSRASGYEDKFGQHSWELDALEPNYIIKLIHDAVRGVIDPELWEDCINLERDEREDLRDAANRWPQVAAYVRELKEQENQ